MSKIIKVFTSYGEELVCIDGEKSCVMGLCPDTRGITRNLLADLKQEAKEQIIYDSVFMIAIYAIHISGLLTI